MLDPLAVFLRSAYDSRGLTPIPLISTEHDVVIASGLAVVATHRVFKNQEFENIEAVLTFPLPVLATLFDLAAEVEGRTLRATAMARSDARQTYEDAIDRGKSAVLHEELLRGLHMISVANLRPAGEIRVTTRWALPLSIIAGRARLRIPQTVGQIYGRLDLPESDDLLTGGPEQKVQIRVRAEGQIEVGGAPLIDGRATLTNARPIDIVADLWEPKTMIGAAVGGGHVALTLTPEPAGERDLSLAVLVDHSGSMGASSSDTSGVSAHDAARSGIVALASAMGGRDFIDLWEFDNQANRVGSVCGDGKNALLQLAETLRPPLGGTEIGEALDAVLDGSEARDILLLTDGLSAALNVETLSKAGRRISVILIGEGSLEARIGYLAALTGGDIFIATADDLASCMAAAIEGLRRPYVPLPMIDKAPDRLQCVWNGVQIRADWSEEPADPVNQDLGQAAVAVGASLMIRCASQALAEKIAVTEGIVSHMTSLVLVDEADAGQETLPVLRKVALPAFEVYACYSIAGFASPMGGQVQAMRVPRMRSEDAPAPSRASKPPAVSSEATGVQMLKKLPEYIQKILNQIRAESENVGSVTTGPTREAEVRMFGAETMRRIAGLIDWGQAPDDLIRGDLSSLPEAVVIFVKKLGATGPADAFSALSGSSAEVSAIALLAFAIAGEDHRANRVWRAIAKTLPLPDPKLFMEALMESLDHVQT